MATALTFVLYTRPSETLRLTVGCIIKPMSSGPQHMHQMAVVLNSSELGIGSKTGQFDESLVLDNKVSG